ncbi:arginine--tRNA ligase [Candidatus Roizmanbacteria bacterium]|nr:arginine--tRNA ligase [Candidatus Roizmanbacteria bacterium]
MIRDKILEKLQEALVRVGVTEEKVELERPANPDFGDYSTSIALKVSKTLKRNPIEVALEIKKNTADNNLIEKIDVIKPGFINFWVSQQTLLERLHSILKSTDSYGRSQLFAGENVMVEYTDPNPFKEFHIGHLYSNIVGESLVRLHEAVGANVKRANYQGDVGMHVAKSIWGMQRKMHDENISLEDLQRKHLQERVRFMGEAYAFGTQQYEKDETVQEETKLLNKKIYALDSEIQELYQKGRQWSLEYFETIYKRLGTSFDYYFFEREVGERGLQIVKKHADLFEQSDGATIFRGEKYGLHTRVFINSLGLPTYEAKDLALAPMKHEQFPYDISIVVTGNEINEYFQVVLKVLEFLNPELRKKTKHISHGMVRLPEGKMSSRKGNIITGESLLNETKLRLKNIIEKSNKISPEDIDTVSEKVSIAAVKYSLLKSSIGKDVIFDFDESLAFEGNSGPYLQYTYARCRSVLRNAGDAGIQTSLSQGNIGSEELLLTRTVIYFPEIVVEATQSLSPHLICNYLYSLAQRYNLFYQKYPILKAQDKQRQLRLVITNATAQILKNGLHLLGIEVVERM